MKNRIVLGIIALLSMLLAAPAPLPEGPFYSYLPLMNRIVPATCPTLTVVEIESQITGHSPCSNWAKISYDPPGNCVVTVQVFDADTGLEVPSQWIMDYNLSNFDFCALVPARQSIYNRADLGQSAVCRPFRRRMRVRGHKGLLGQHNPTRSMLGEHIP